jgi:hypothetical protein
MSNIQYLHGKVDEITVLLQMEYNKQFSDWHELRVRMESLEKYEGIHYSTDEYGELISLIPFEGLRDVPTRDQEYLATYLSEHCLYVNWPGRYIYQHHGNDHIVIQDDGVWQYHRLLFTESAYLDPETGEVDEVLRNKLIERHMDKEGCYPGVFLVSRNGDITPVDTSAAREVTV